MNRVLVVRQDNNGDVLLAGPAIRGIARDFDRVTMLCGPRGAAAAAMLPGIDDLIVWEAPWIDPDPRPVNAGGVMELVAGIEAQRFSEAIVFTSFHQNPLPTALLLRMAGIPKIAAISVDYAGSLLDVRHRVRDDIHEVERNLSLAAAAGHAPLQDDDRRLRVRGFAGEHCAPPGRYVVVHPGCTMPARAWYEDRNAALVELLVRRDYRVVITGATCERPLARRVGGNLPGVTNLAGRTTFAEFASVLSGALAVIAGNTVAPHLAAACGTPVVSIFPPTVPAVRFRPWMVDHVLLGDQEAPCAGCRARVCPIPGQPCLDAVTPEVVIEAMETLLARTAEMAS
jgi:ADP-heptose:LPS heptosyltransferase